MVRENHVEKFFKNSGFKILALARLSPCEYSLVLYFLNCAVSGLDDIITTEAELASLIGYDDEDVRKTLLELSKKNIIKLNYSDKFGDNASMRVGMQYDLKEWVLNYEAEATSQDAIVFPFRRQGGNRLTVVSSEKKTPRPLDKESTWKRVLESFIQNRSLDSDEIDEETTAAKTLVDTHPVDQVLLMVRYFTQRIPSLSLLASSWQHYQEIFEDETQKVDLHEIKNKHRELDQKIRAQASDLLANSKNLTEEEVAVLQILQKHRHPRRQLFWAYQARSRYPNLTSFFADNASLMLPVTSGGAVIKRPPQ